MLYTAVGAAFFAWAGCGDGGHTGHSASGEDPPALEASIGSWSGTLALDPWPSVVGDNRLELYLIDEDGAALEGATVEVSPWMPAHGHGSVDVMAKESEPGHYSTDKIYLNMPGLWELRVHVTRDDEEGRLVATFEVP